MPMVSSTGAIILLLPIAHLVTSNHCIGSIAVLPLLPLQVSLMTEEEEALQLTSKKIRGRKKDNGRCGIALGTKKMFTIRDLLCG